MIITDYLDEIQHAVETVIGEIHRENEQVTILKNELRKLNAATKDGYDRADFLARNPDVDDEGLGTLMHWDTYFGSDKQRYYKQNETDVAVLKLEVHELSIASLSGSLLQNAKQGISLKYGRKRTGCPQGRLIVGIELHEIIWQGRNQALHWEDGKFTSPVKKCFLHLTNNVNPLFANYTTRNMAYDIVNLLGWKTFSDFSNDMMLLE